MGDLGHGKELSDAPGVVGVTRVDCPALPDDILTNPRAGFLDPRRWFQHPDRPFDIEIGSGKGTFLVNQASNDAEANYLGIEWAYEFYLYAADRVRRRGLSNVRMLCTDASEFLRWRCPEQIVRTIHLYYSDPWPKKKHHKNRVIQDKFLGEAWRVLIPGGELRVVTDHDELWAWDEEHFARWTSPGGGPHGRSPAPFERLAFTPPEWVGEGELVATNYERKFRREDRLAHACVLRKVDL